MTSIFNGVDEGVDFLLGGVKIKRSADRGYRPQQGGKDFGAVIARTAGNATAIKVSRRVLGKDPIDIKGNDSRFAIGIVNRDFPGFLQFFDRVFF